MKKFICFILALMLVTTLFDNVIYAYAASFAQGITYTEEEIQKMRDEANTYERMSQKVDSPVFNWLYADRLILLNAQNEASEMGHSALLLLDDEDRGVFFSYYPINSSFPDVMDYSGDVRMKYLSQQDIRDFWRTGNIENVVSSAWKNETITDGGYNRGIIKKLTTDGSLIYEKMLELFVSPQQYKLIGHQCDDVALTLFCETEIEFLYIWGSTFNNPAPNVTYKHLASLADGEEYSILADFLLYQRTEKNGTAPSEVSNENVIAFSMYIGEHIDMPELLVLSSEGKMPDGRKYKKYYFKDQDVFGNENAVESSGDLSTRYLICVGDTIVEEMFLLFAKAGNGVLGGQHDEIYRRVTIGTETIKVPESLITEPAAEIINGIYYIRNYTLEHSGGSMATLGVNVVNSSNGHCASKEEAKVDNFLYWDASKGTVLSSTEWKETVHYSERYALNQDYYLPANVVEALEQGFEKLPVEEAKYHQINPDLGELDYGACLKFIHRDGREAVYKVDTYSKDYENDIAINPASTTLLKLEDYPNEGPTFNYSPNDSAGSIVWWDLINRFSSFTASKVSVNSVAHYYFDMLPYYWWGNTPATSIHNHNEQIDEAIVSTCQTYGLTEGSHCSLCGQIIKSQTFLPLASHRYENGICCVCGEEEIVRYTVLVLDTSGRVTFSDNDVQIYEADTAIEYVKEASKKFVDSLAKDNTKNYIAVVSYKDTATVTSDFTTDTELLKDKIDGLFDSSRRRDISAGLEKANELLSAIEEENVKKNVVLCTTGMTNGGDYDYDGVYDENTIASDWYQYDSGVCLYAYANVALEGASRVKENANLYVLGLFQTMSEMPEEGRDIVDFFRLTAKDIAGSEEYFYDIVEVSDIDFKFGEVADDISDKDTDGDGLLDNWEMYGVDTDNDGKVDLRLDLMGADPNVPDIFVEIDWMTIPRERISIVTTQQETCLSPSAASMYMVYQVFKNHGINLHIDAGPSSVDYVTGKQWGKLSGGNEIEYVKSLNLNGNERDSFNGWSEYVADNFSVNRENIFKHCMFVNQIEGDFYNKKINKWESIDKETSGIANGIPSQYFIVANQKWIRDSGDIGIAGTFMHELGHTLGLSHGGFDDEGKNNHDRNKPNYLSIMNYLFQISGLSGTGELNYSEYDLPDLDENALSERSGVDPNGLTAGTGLGTKFAGGVSWLKSNREIVPIARREINFDGSLSGIEDKLVSVDINNDGKLSALTSSTDWDHLVYTMGNGVSNKNTVNIQGVSFGDVAPSPDELFTLEKAIANNSLAAPGTIALEALGPYTLFTGLKSQNSYVRVLNMTSEKTTVHHTVEATEITEAQNFEIIVPASVDDISYVDVKIPIINATKEGAYFIHVIGVTGEDTVKDIYLPINIQTVTAEELGDLYQAINEADEDLPYTMLTEYENALNDCAIKGHTGGEWVIDKEAKAGVAGEKHISCVKCGEVMEVAVIYPLPDDSEPETSFVSFDETTDDTNFMDFIANKIHMPKDRLLVIACSSLGAIIFLVIVIIALKKKRR